MRLEENLQHVRARLLKSDFQFKRLRPVFIAKGGGRDRVICVTTEEDRLVQRLILNYLNTGDKLKVANNVSYGFRKGYGIRNAIEASRKIRREHRWVLKTDIQSFFDKIQRDGLKAEIVRRLGKSSFAPLICNAIDVEIRCDSEQDRARIARAGIVEGMGLRQGMPLSPILSNVVLGEFDKTLQRKGIRIVRYADDFVVFADSELECREALLPIKEILSKKGHSIPDPGTDSKTVIYSPSETVEFLGFDLRQRGNSYEMAAPQAAFEELQKNLERFQDFDTAVNKWKSFSQTMSTLGATVRGFLNAYEPTANFNDLTAHAQNLRELSMRRLLKSVFGSDVLVSLDKRRKAFLDIFEQD